MGSWQEPALYQEFNYFRADSGLPKFDELTFLIFPDANSAMSCPRGRDM